MSCHNLFHEVLSQFLYWFSSKTLSFLPILLCLPLEVLRCSKLALLLCSLIGEWNTGTNIAVFLWRFVFWRRNSFTIEWWRWAHVVPHRDNFIKEDPRVISSSKDAINILISQSAQVLEAGSHLSIAETKLAISVTSTYKEVTSLCEG